MYARVMGARAEPKLESFPCRLLCMECRFLADPPRGGDPMRTEADRDPEPCPHCGSTSWLDLRHEDAKRQIDEVDAIERVEDRKKRVLLAGKVLVSLWVLQIFIGMTAGNDANTLLDILFGIVLFAVVFGPIIAIVLVPMLSGFTVASKRRTSPSRWRLPTPRSPRRRGRPVRGTLDAAEELRSPLTGRACAAYELGIRRDSSASAKSSTWALLEQRSAPLGIADIELGANRPYLKLDRDEVDRDALELRGEALSMFLRARGLDPAGSYRFFETIVPKGTACRVWPGASGHTPVLEAA